jgi:hypothetical protein
MKLDKLQQEMFDAAYALTPNAGYPSYADLCYSSDLSFRLVRSSHRGARRWYKERTARGRAMVRRNWMRRYPKLFTKQARQSEGLA